MADPSFDAAVIGAGPAGATAARLLAAWGYRVLLLTRREPDVPALVESLPPSVRKIFGLVGLTLPRDESAFAPYRGNTSWWGGGAMRVEPFGDGSSGYQVNRGVFDALLRDLAGRAGAVVRLDATVRGVPRDGATPRLVVASGREAGSEEVQARFVLDCSGRAGVIARGGLRVPDRRFQTLALIGRWRRPGGFELEEPSHTLVEAFDRGWAWSVPAGAERRQVAVMIDRSASRSGGGRGMAAHYLDGLRDTSAMARLLEGASQEEAVWSREASMYAARAHSGPGWLLVGDAASFVDPLASIGVKKAMTSAWRAAVVVNTCLRRPELADPALRYFDERERAVHRECRRLAAGFFAESSNCYDGPFWKARAEALHEPRSGEDVQSPGDWQLVRQPDVLAAFERLRASPSIRLRRAPDFRLAPQPDIVGREVVLADAVAGGRLPRGLRYVEGVNLPALVVAAEQHDQVPAVFGEYVRREGPVGFREFLGALSVLVGTGLLLNQAETDQADT